MPDLWMDVDTALSEVPVNVCPLIDDTDFKTREESVVYNQAGLDLVWNFITTAGAFTQTAVTPTTSGVYDWTNQLNGMYSIEIPASAGGSINNDTEGMGWFSGFATGVLPWRGPTIGFRAAGINNLLIDSAYSTTRGLVGTALPAAAADAAGGVPISDLGGLDLDSKLANTNEITAARMGALTDWINGGRLDLILDIIAADTTTDIPGLIATLQADLDLITGSDGVTLATAQGLYAPSKAGDLMGLINNAITNGKYDESTAFPLTAVNGSTLTEAGGTGDHLTALATSTAQTTAQNDLDTITGADGVTLATAQALYAPNVVVPDAAGTAPTAAEINTEMDTALSDIGLDHLVSASVTGTDVTDDSIIARLVSASATADWDDFDNLVASLQAISESVGSLSVGSAAISVEAESYTLTTGTQSSGTVSDTETLNGVSHQHTDTGGVMELYYQHDVTGAGIAVNAVIQGYINGSNDTVGIYAYDWGGTAWDQVGAMVGQNISTVNNYSLSLLTRHTGTGANTGKVRIRLYAASGLSSATLYVDQIFVSYSVVAQTVGYADGAIWVDTNASNTNTEIYVDGTADNPVSAWAAALTLSVSLGIIRFHIINGSTITFTGNSDNYTLIGNNWTLALGGQSVAGAYIHGASTVSGTGTGSGTIFSDCKLANGVGLTIPDCFAFRCGIAGDIVFTAAGTYYFDQCYSGVAGTSTPSIDFGAAVANTNVNFRHYSGGIEIKNMGANGTDNMSLEGHGQYVLNANCAGGTLAVRGLFKKTDNSLAVTIDDNANFKSSVIHYGIARTAGSPGVNQIQMATTASSADGAYDPSLIFLESGAGAGQSGLCYQYDGTTKIATIDRDWKVVPNATTEYRVVAHPGREHVNEGLAQAGAAGTITLNALASSVDNAYNKQLIFLRSGTGGDQVRVVTDYNGTTKIATISPNWGTNPDATTGYVVLPNHIHAPSDIVDEWETQSQADPTGFHVNVLEVNGTSQTANDNGADINAILVGTGTTIPAQIAALENISADDVWDAVGSDTSLSFESIIERIFQFFNNELAVVDATGGFTLRNFGDSGDMASWTITDDDTTTDRTAISWA